MSNMEYQKKNLKLILLLIVDMDLGVMKGFLT